MPSHFKFKEYCPLVFRNLRERFGIDDQDFQVGAAHTHTDTHRKGESANREGKRGRREVERRGGEALVSWKGSHDQLRA